MLEHDYDGVHADSPSYSQIMFTLDLAEERSDSGVTATFLHPAT